MRDILLVQRLAVHFEQFRAIAKRHYIARMNGSMLAAQIMKLFALFLVIAVGLMTQLPCFADQPGCSITSPDRPPIWYNPTGDKPCWPVTPLASLYRNYFVPSVVSCSGWCRVTLSSIRPPTLCTTHATPTDGHWTSPAARWKWSQSRKRCDYPARRWKDKPWSPAWS